MHKSSKIIVWVIVCVLLTLTALGVAATTWVSTPSGTQTVVRWINQSIKGKLSVDKVSVNWVGAQHVENFSFQDEHGNEIFSFNQFDTKTSLLYLVLGGRSLGATTVISPSLKLPLFSDSSENKGDFEEKKSKQKTLKEIGAFSFVGPLSISNGRMILAQKNQPIVTLSEIQIEKKDQHNLSLRAHSESEGHRGSVAIEADLKQMAAAVHLVDFPIAVVDALYTSPYPSAALGATLSGDFNLEKKDQGAIFLKGEAHSDNLTAFVDGYTQDNQFILNPQTHLQLTITPSFFNLLLDEKQRGNWNLASKTQLEIQVEKAAFPLNRKANSFQDISLSATCKIARAELHHAHLGSYTLKEFNAAVIALNNIEISYQGEILGKESTQLSGNISITPKAEILYQANFKGFPVTLLELFSPKIAANLKTVFGTQFDLVSRGIVAGQKIDAEISVTSPIVKGQGNLKGEIEKLFFEMKGTRTLVGDSAHIIGKSFEFLFLGTLHASKQDFYISTLSGKLWNPYFHIDLLGSMGEAGKAFVPEKIHLVATGAIINLPSQELSEPTALLLEVDGPNNQILGKIEGNNTFVDFAINSFIHNHEIHFEQSIARFVCDVIDFPTIILNPLISETIDLATFIGPKLSLHAQGTYTANKDPRIVLDLDATATGFSTSLAVSIDGTLTVDPTKPSYIKWEVTPERYLALMQALRLHPEVAPTFVLTQPSEIQINISQFTCPTTWPKKLGSLLCQSGFVGEVHIPRTTFQARNRKETIVFQDVKGSIKGVDFSEAIDLSLSGEIMAAPIPRTETSAFSFEGQMLNFWTKTGKFNREKLTVKGVLNLDLLPVRPILGILPLDKETRDMAQALLGELVNAQIQGEMSQLTGPITVDINSSNFKALLPLQMQPHALFLRDDVNAEITLTQAVNDVFLKDINPLLLTGAYSEHPIKLSIAPQGFMIPLRPYSLEGIRIGKAVVDIGKIRVRNGGQIQALMEFLKAKEITSDGMMEAWFTPIILSYQNGVATYQRFDMLIANSIHIALWGRINLLTNQVNMTLGIAETTLNQRFKISGLQDRDMFQIKMRGTTDHLDLDWGSASKRLAFILTRTTAGGGLGSLIGSILEAFSSSLGEEPVPPPTSPFPWEHS